MAGMKLIGNPISGYHASNPNYCCADVLLDQFEETAPADLMDEVGFAVDRKPDKERLTYNVILRHKSPVTRIQRVMAIISHHEVIILFEGILAHFTSIDVQF